MDYNNPPICCLVVQKINETTKNIDNESTVVGSTGFIKFWSETLDIAVTQGSAIVNIEYKPTGQTGINTILNGHELPNSNIGNTGDFYINTDTSFFYGPKDSDWGNGISIIGPTGPQGIPGIVVNSGCTG